MEGLGRDPGATGGQAMGFLASGRFWQRRMRGRALEVALLAALGGGSMVTACGPAEQESKETGGEPPTMAAAGLERLTFALADDPDSSWFEPPVLRSEGGELEVKLEVRMAPGEVLVDDPPRPQAVNLRRYTSPQVEEQGIVGPTLRVRAGDKIDLFLTNGLPAYEPGVCEGHGGHHALDCLNDTNFHTHGLHISPSRNSDNVLLNIKPQAPTEHFEFYILPATPPWIEPEPGTHYPGTFWYHAHRHGSTATQVASGMAGALIIEDPEEIPEIEGIRERVVLLQQLAFDADGEIKKFNDLRPNWDGQDPQVNGPPKYTTINGKVKPRVAMRPNEVQRWRIIDGSIFEMIPFSLVSSTRGAQEMQLIAIDGITLKLPRSVSALELGPGYRRDVLVKAPAALEEGERLEVRKDTSGIVFIGADSAGSRQILAEVILEGEDCAADPACISDLLPPDRALPAPLPDIEAHEVDSENFAIFNIADNKFTVNGEEFQEGHVMEQFQLSLGEVQEWKLGSERGDHPFHIHVNAFQVLNPDGTPGDWHDTLIVGTGEGTLMRTRYERFTGRFVLHCHILNHEDLGMMQLVEIE